MCIDNIIFFSTEIDLYYDARTDHRLPICSFNIDDYRVQVFKVLYTLLETCTREWRIALRVGVGVEYV